MECFGVRQETLRFELGLIVDSQGLQPSLDLFVEDSDLGLGISVGIGGEELALGILFLGQSG